MLSQLQMLREIEEWASTKPSEYTERFVDWEHHNYINNNNFEYVEPLFSQRIAICKMKQARENNEVVKSALLDVYLELVQLAEQKGDFRVATRTLGTIYTRYELFNKLIIELD